MSAVGRTLYRIETQPLRVETLVRLLDDPGCGAQALFLGVVRNEFEGRASRGILYEAYEPLAVAEMGRIGTELQREYGVGPVVMVHRVGTLRVGEASVLVGCAAPHRRDALVACAEGIERLKHRVPIWKQELWADGDSAWHGAPDGPPANDG